MPGERQRLRAGVAPTAYYEVICQDPPPTPTTQPQDSITGSLLAHIHDGALALASRGEDMLRQHSSNRVDSK